MDGPRHLHIPNKAERLTPSANCCELDAIADPCDNVKHMGAAALTAPQRMKNRISSRIRFSEDSGRGQ